MKKSIALLCFALFCITGLAQDSMEKTMELRAREMFRVITLNSPADWKKFIKENYTKALIDKPMRAQVDDATSGPKASATATTVQIHEGNIEGKARMYQMLHDDFGEGKITALKTTGDQIDMVVTNGDMKGTFTLKFTKAIPYLIEAIGIEMGN